MSSNTGGTIAKNTLFMYIRMALSILIGLYTSRVVLQTLGVEDYGIYNVVGGIVSLFIFLNNALGQATQRFIAYELGKSSGINSLKRTFSMCLNIHILIALLIVLLAETVGLWLVFNKLVIPENRFHTALLVYQFSIVAAVISITQVPYNAEINAHEKFNVFALISIFDSLLRLSLVIALKYIQGDLLFWYGLMVLVANTTQTILFRTYCRIKFIECKYEIFWDKKLFHRVLDYTAWSLFGNLADTLSDQGVNVLLNMFFGPAVNASRGIAITIKTSVAGFVYSFQSVANPQIVKRYAVGDTHSMISLVFRTSKLSFFLYLLMMLPLCMEMEVVLKVWLGDIPEYLKEFSILTLLTVLLQSLGGTLQAAIQASGRIKLYQILVGGAKLLTIPICYVGLKAGLSPIYPFIVVMIIYSAVVYVNLYVTKKILDFPILQYLKQVILVDFVVLLMSLIIPFLLASIWEESYFRAIVLIPVCIISVVLTSFLVGFNKEERIWMIEMVSSKIRRR